MLTAPVEGTPHSITPVARNKRRAIAEIPVVATLLGQLRRRRRRDQALLEDRARQPRR